MKITLQIPDSMNIDVHVEEYRGYLQAMLNRMLVGEMRYGVPKKEKRYMRRLAMELRAYRQQGNFEQLINISNYAYLESMAPENRKLYFDPAAASVTRGILDKTNNLAQGSLQRTAAGKQKSWQGFTHPAYPWFTRPGAFRLPRSLGAAEIKRTAYSACGVPLSSGPCKPEISRAFAASIMALISE